jgi:hypothetical protein
MLILYPNREQHLLIGWQLWQNDLRNEGSVFQDLDQVILDEARMQQTRIRSIQNHNFIEN